MVLLLFFMTSFVLYFNLFTIYLFYTIFIFLHCNHKTLGLYYLYSSMILGISGSLYSILLRLELYSSGNRIISPENQNFYNLSFTLHGLFMIFYLVMPGLYGGFGNYLIPIYFGSSEVGFPRVNGFSFYLIFPISISFILVGSVSEFPGGPGWTLYPPLSISLTVPLQIYLIIKSLFITGISSILSSINFYSTLSNMKCPSLNLGIIYLFPWAIFIILYLLLLTLPILSGTLGILLADLYFNTIYLDPAFGGDPVLYQHFFWFFGHPEVYILIIPAFGILNQILSGITGNIIIYGNQSMVLAMSCISILGSFVWGHHIYTIGLETDTRSYFTGLTIMISLPTGTKLMNWLCTILGNVLKISISSGCLFILSILIMFTLGGSTGIVLGNAAIDVALHDTYYVIAHFHFILSLGAIISIIVGVLYSQEIYIAGFPFYISLISIFYFIMKSIGIIMTFTPMHFLGYNFQPRRVYEFPDNYNCWNFLSSMGSGITVLSMIVVSPLIL